MAKLDKTDEIPLSEAAKKFAPKMPIKSVKLDGIKILHDAVVVNYDRKIADIAENVLDSVSNLFNDHQFIIHQQDWLRSAIEKGLFVASGRQTNTTDNLSRRVEIPPDLFCPTASINWRGSTISSAGLTFEIVRVSPAAKGGSTQPLPHYNQIRSQRRGRPTKETEILMIIEEITKNGYKFGTKKRILECEMIRDHARIKLNVAELNGYSDPVLQRIIYRKLNA